LRGGEEKAKMRPRAKAIPGKLMQRRVMKVRILLPPSFVFSTIQPMISARINEMIDEQASEKLFLAM
jgi:hypothetical protein